MPDADVRKAAAAAEAAETGVAGPDLARVRHDNALRLFDEFVRASVRSPDAATLRGLERRFAERMLIQPSYWSQIKARARQIGERLARQFERAAHKPPGWMDVDHDAAPAAAAPGPGALHPIAAAAAAVLPPAAPEGLPADDDERFIVGLVLTYYRRHPQRARARLLDLLGEVLTPPAAAPAAPAAVPSAAALPAVTLEPLRGPLAARRAPPAPPADPDAEAWQSARGRVQPLKRGR